MSNRLEEFATLVLQMRDAQRAREDEWTYVRDLSPQLISTAKELERRVDAEARAILDSQGKLFE